MSTESPPPAPSEAAPNPEKTVPPTPPAPPEVPPTPPPTPEEVAATEEAEARLKGGAEAAREAQAEKPEASRRRRNVIRAGVAGGGAIGLTGLAEAAKLGGGSALTGATAAAASGSGFWLGALKFVAAPALFLYGLYKLDNLKDVLAKVANGEMKLAEFFKKAHAAGGGGHGHGGGAHGGGGGHGKKKDDHH